MRDRDGLSMSSNVAYVWLCRDRSTDRLTGKSPVILGMWIRMYVLANPLDRSLVSLEFRNSSSSLHHFRYSIALRGPSVACITVSFRLSVRLSVHHSSSSTPLKTLSLLLAIPPYRNWVNRFHLFPYILRPHVRVSTMKRPDVKCKPEAETRTLGRRPRRSPPSRLGNDPEYKTGDPLAAAAGPSGDVRTGGVRTNSAIGRETAGEQVLR